MFYHKGNICTYVIASPHILQITEVPIVNILIKIQDVPTTNFCAPNCFGCPVNFCFGVEPFVAEKDTPPSKIGLAKNVIERQKFGIVKKLLLN